jgi:class 3 adenylate cyclase
VAPGAELAFTPRLQPGRYRLRIHGQTRYHILDVTDVTNSSDVAGSGASEKVEWRASVGGDRGIGAGATLVLRNDTGEPVQFVIENTQWNDMALRPARLFNLQDFRDLFAEEYLATDVQIAVGEQAILFTDMVGSTRFYASQGDPKAFIEIKKHFAEVYAVIGDHEGAVVKTIGDAVMGAFGNALNAVKAARKIHERFSRDREDTPIRLRISLNTGPCIAVNLNSGIDYFGTTVNLAAKLQACADAGDIAMTTGVVEAPGVREYLDAQGAALATDTYRSDALEQDVPVLCWSLFSS